MITVTANTYLVVTLESRPGPRGQSRLETLIEPPWFERIVKIMVYYTVARRAIFYYNMLELVDQINAKYVII